MTSRSVEQLRGPREPLGRFLEGVAGGAGLDVREKADRVVVSCDLGDFAKEDLDVRVTGRTLTISARRAGARRHGRGQAAVYKETRQSVTLPAEVRGGEATARLEGGVLRVELPKAKATETRRVTID